MADVTVPTVPPLATQPNVELIHTGTWDARFGEWTATVDDLSAAVAALDCPAVRRPIIKLGHTPPHGQPPPGEPAVGWVANLATAENGRTLVGDYMGMPGWLGEVLASAYPDRSIEGEYDYRCQLGHTHPFVLHAVALLGVDRPAVGTLQSLQDVAELYGVAASEAPTGTPITITVRAQEVAAVTKPRPRQVAAGVTTEDVRRAYYAGPGDSWDQWIESMELDPLQLIVMDDAKSKRYRVAVTVGDGDGEDAVSFGDPVEVVIRYEDAQVAASASTVALVWASRAESRPPNSPAATGAARPTQHKEGAGMDPAKMREALGLKADASDDEVRAALATAGLAPQAAPAELEPAATGDASQPKAGQPTASAKAVPGTMTIDASAWNEREVRIKRLEAEAAKRAREERDQVIAAAVQAGKFAPSRKEHWARLWDADPEGTRQVLAGLQANVVPVEATGYAGGEDEEFNAEFRQLFPPTSEPARKG